MEDRENGAKRLWNGYPKKDNDFLLYCLTENEKVLEMGRPKSKSNCD